MEIVNKKAYFNYFIDSELEAGIVLKGTEIKSVRKGTVNLTDSYIRIKKNEAYIINMFIDKYDEGNIFNHEELKDMALEPCVYGTQWLVKEGKLHLILNQRSQDMLAANGWNTMQYAALLCMFAQVAGLEVGTLTHNIGDCHIYDRHIPIIEKLIEAKPMDVCPKLVINNPTKNFYDFKVEDFEIQGYDYNHDINIGKIPVAV